MKDNGQPYFVYEQQHRQYFERYASGALPFNGCFWTGVMIRCGSEWGNNAQTRFTLDI